MSETLVQLNGNAGPARAFAQCEGFLLGPRGEVWDLYPRIGSVPRLLAEGRDGVAALPGVSNPARVGFMITHQSRYLALTGVTDYLEPGIRFAEIKDGRFELETRDGHLAVIDARLSMLARSLATLRSERWVGPAVTSYLLVAPRSADVRRLLAFAKGFELERPEPRAWERSFEAGARGRLSTLAEAKRPLSRSLASRRSALASL